MTTPVPSGGNGDGSGWYGPQNPLEPIFPLNPSIGYIPPPPNPPSDPLPRYALWGYDNGLIAYVRNS